MAMLSNNLAGFESSKFHRVSLFIFSHVQFGKKIIQTCYKFTSEALAFWNEPSQLQENVDFFLPQENVELLQDMSDAIFRWDVKPWHPTASSILLPLLTTFSSTGNVLLRRQQADRKVRRQSGKENRKWRQSGKGRHLCHRQVLRPEFFSWPAAEEEKRLQKFRIGRHRNLSGGPVGVGVGVVQMRDSRITGPAVNPEPPVEEAGVDHAAGHVPTIPVL